MVIITQPRIRVPVHIHVHKTETKVTLTAGNTLCYFLFFPIYLIRNNSGDYNPSIWFHISLTVTVESLRTSVLVPVTFKQSKPKEQQHTSSSLVALCSLPSLFPAFSLTHSLRNIYWAYTEFLTLFQLNFLNDTLDSLFSLSFHLL